MNIETNPRETIGEQYRHRKEGNESAGVAFGLIGAVFAAASLLGMYEDGVTYGRALICAASFLLVALGAALFRHA